MALSIIKETFDKKKAYFKAAIVVKLYSLSIYAIYMHYKFVPT